MFFLKVLSIFEAEGANILCSKYPKLILEMLFCSKGVHFKQEAGWFCGILID